MAASGNAELTQLQDMEEEDAGMEEREMQSDEEDEEGMGEENTDDSSEDEKENEAEIQRLEEQLSINAFDYNCHVDLIKLLKQEGELLQLQKARQKMSELFPLTEEIWLDWLKDEIRLNEEQSNRETVYELFERAVKDYICPEIWLEYAQYSIGGMGSPGGIDKVRCIFERAVTAVGLHMTKGQLVWEAYREFENAILSTVQPPPGRIPSCEEQEMLNTQLERIHKLFRRQLTVPLMDMETTYEEYEDWSDQGVSELVVPQYTKAMQEMEKRKSLEESLLIAEPPKMSEYQTYIDFERKEGDPARILIIFERALAENCLVPDLWAKYTSYLDRQLKIKEVVLSAHERAVRNCPWTMGLWKSYLQALERHGADHQTVSGQLTSAAAMSYSSFFYVIEQAPKRHKGNGDQTTEEYMETETGLVGKNGPPGYNLAQSDTKKPQRGPVVGAMRQNDDKQELRNDKSSVFISNLAYTLEEPEAKLRTLFEMCGSIEQVRPIFGNKGAFKGYCYIQFESASSVTEALKLDRRELEGRPMFVSPCVDKNKNPDFKVFKYNASMEKHKIFITGLPFSCTKEQLEEICKKHGSVREVRLVTYRSGKPKGLAYVEFADDTQASQAVLKMDGTEVEGNMISVAISNPPRRNTMEPPGSGKPMGNMMPRQVYGARGKGRTQVSLLPRSLHRQTGSITKVENGGSTESSSSSLNAATETKSLSNSDFARMLLNK
ncbi:squamous cell carcinoma antigen recognized by T-cells 3-like [Cynoglossus semilaevis]|uniref:squamous cell carcinoma antigen recognized by T-cells 3-like n=1 Tax=Cynoglossus semilaevis TaxID=244447 RepID=UPI000D62AA51|nr:squamous cell carcinoma antigen recognized by T-cells 3-like [Cynoglossus semilaevis]